MLAAKLSAKHFSYWRCKAFPKRQNLCYTFTRNEVEGEQQKNRLVWLFGWSLISPPRRNHAFRESDSPLQHTSKRRHCCQGSRSKARESLDFRRFSASDHRWHAAGAEIYFLFESCCDKIKSKDCQCGDVSRKTFYLFSAIAIRIERKLIWKA